MNTRTDDSKTFQLQLWNATAKTYVPQSDKVMLLGDRGKAWRICKPSRPLKPKYAGPRCTASTHTADEVRYAYHQWAILVGLQTITDWSSKRYAKRLHYYGKVNYVNPDDYFAVTVEEEA